MRKEIREKILKEIFQCWNKRMFKKVVYLISSYRVKCCRPYYAPGASSRSTSASSRSINLKKATPSRASLMAFVSALSNISWKLSHVG